MAICIQPTDDLLAAIAQAPEGAEFHLAVGDHVLPAPGSPMAGAAPARPTGT